MTRLHVNNLPMNAAISDRDMKGIRGGVLAFPVQQAVWLPSSMLRFLSPQPEPPDKPFARTGR